MADQRYRTRRKPDDADHVLVDLPPIKRRGRKFADEQRRALANTARFLAHEAEAAMMLPRKALPEVARMVADFDNHPVLPFDSVIASRILGLMSVGMRLSQMEPYDWYPGLRNVFSWARESQEFERNLREARKFFADFIAEQCLDISDQPVDGDMAEVQRHKLQIETRRWYAAQHNWKAYGQRMAVDVTATETKTLEIGFSEKGLAALEALRESRGDSKSGTRWLVERVANDATDD